MATIEVAFPVSDGLGTAGSGDTHAQSFTTLPNSFDETLTTGFVGSAVKASEEFDLLLRFEIGSIPRGSVSALRL